MDTSSSEALAEAVLTLRGDDAMLLLITDSSVLLLLLLLPEDEVDGNDVCIRTIELVVYLSMEDVVVLNLPTLMLPE